MNNTFNNKKIPNVPNLRFPEFTDEWVETQLGKCAKSFEYGMNAAATKFDGINKYIRITDINEATSKYNLVNPVSPAGILTDKYLVKENDILFTRTGASTGKTYIYDATDGKLYFAGFLIRGRIDKHVSAKFVFYQTQSQKYDKWVKLMSARSGQPGINSCEYSSYNFFKPKAIEEQTKIAKLLSIIDQRLETQNKIIEDLKLLKKSLCAILLHNKNWEEQKIGDISKLGRGRVISTTEINIQKHPKYPVYSSQTSNNGIMGYLDNYDFAGEYLTWTTDGANAGTVFYRNGKFNCTNVCGTIHLKANYDAYFICHQLKRSTQKFVSSNLANPKLMNNTMANIKISMPLYDTQVKFGYIFKLFDNKIILENMIIDNYKKQKKHLLNNLFI